MGEQLAYELARKGSSLVLVDRDATRLKQVAGTVRSRTTTPVTTYVVDLADEEATRGLGDQLAAEHPDIRLLINNAGVALAGTFDQVDAEEFDWLLAVNLRAVVTLTRAMLTISPGFPETLCAWLAHLEHQGKAWGMCRWTDRGSADIR